MSEQGQSFDKLRTNGSLDQSLHLYAIAIGSNRPHGRFGRPAGVVVAAIARLKADYDLIDSSPVMLNPAQGGAGRCFANAVVLIKSSLEPRALLLELKAVEREYGRRRGRLWGPRVLDLDIIAWNGPNIHQRDLIIPHPSLMSRDFVLRPLSITAPKMRLTGGLTANHLRRRLYKAIPRN